MAKIKYANNPNKLQSEIKELNKIQVNGKNFLEFKHEILRDHLGEFEKVDELSIADHIRQTHIRFRNITDYESHINYIDQDYESEDAIFNEDVYKINTPQCNLVHKSQYGNGCDFKHEIIKHRGNNCFIPTKGYFFIKCLNFLTGEDYKQKHMDFIRNEKRRSNNITMARIQPFCRSKNNNLAYFDGMRVFPRTVTERNLRFIYTIITFVYYGNLKMLASIKLLRTER